MNKDVRWAAATRSLGSGHPRWIRLIAALDDKDSVVRLRAAWALGQIGDKRPVDKLILTLRDGDWSVRMRAAEALGNLRAQRQPMPSCSSEGLKWRCTRACYMQTLGKIADPVSADRIGGILKDPDWKVKLGATLALASIGTEKSLTFLKNMSCDENEYVRKIAHGRDSKTDDGNVLRKKSVKIGYANISLLRFYEEGTNGKQGDSTG